MNQGERLVLDCLIHRKLEKSIDDYIKDHTLCSKSVTKAKRLEENYKMVFKSALKHLGNTFKKNKKSKKSKSDDSSFYDHYFGNLAIGQGLPIETFFHPNKKMKAQSKKNLPNQKTMNSKYLDSLLSSSVFCVDLEQFLDQHFIENYTSRRRKKIDNLVEKLRKKFLLSDVQDRLTELTDYL